MVISQEKWQSRKEEFLNQNTLQIIADDWVPCNLENRILSLFYELWVRVQAENGIWRPEIAEKALKAATNTAFSESMQHNIPLCSLLARMTNMVNNYYWTWRNR